MPPPPASVLCSIARVLRIGLISVDWNARSMVGLSVTVMIGFEAISGCCVMLPAFLPENRRGSVAKPTIYRGLSAMRLVGDIGGTNVRFAIAEPGRHPD